MDEREYKRKILEALGFSGYTGEVETSSPLVGENPDAARVQPGPRRKKKRRFAPYKAPSTEWIKKVLRDRKANPPPWLLKIREDNRKKRIDPIKIECYRIYNKALQDGTLVRPDKCSIDNEDCHGKIQGHHEDYKKPLDVEWLCKFHHDDLHLKKWRKRRKKCQTG